MISLTLKDIAKIANVSIATVSKVVNNKTDDLSEETIKRVSEILEENNYVPNVVARSMKTKTTFTIGLIIPDIRNAFFTEVVKGAQDLGFALGYSLLIASSDNIFEKELELIRMFNEKQVDGLLLAGTTNRKHKQELDFNVNIPTVAVDRSVDFPFIINKVSTHNDIAGEIATNYLIENGHKKILFLSGPKTSEVAVDRLKGCKEAFVNNNFEFLETDVMYGEFTSEAARKLILEKDNIKDYTAIFCANDLMAYGTLIALNELKIQVPKDISLISIDDIAFSQLTNPGLTTVKQESYLLGQRALSNLIKYITTKKNVGDIKLMPNLIIRSSVKSLLL